MNTRTKIVYVLFSLSYLLTVALFLLYFKDYEKPKELLSANEYCVSKGWDRAGEKDISTYRTYPYGSGTMKRVRCVKEENGETGTLDADGIINGFMWYRYPPKTELENYCQGNL